MLASVECFHVVKKGTDGQAFGVIGGKVHQICGEDYGTGNCGIEHLFRYHQLFSYRGKESHRVEGVAFLQGDRFFFCVDIPMTPRADLRIIVGSHVGQNGQKQNAPSADVYHVASTLQPVLCRILLQKANVFVNRRLGEALAKQVTNVRRTSVFVSSQFVDGQDANDLSE